MIMPTEQAVAAKPFTRVQIEKKLERIAKLKAEIDGLQAQQNDAVTLARGQTQGQIDRKAERIKAEQAEIEDWALSTRAETFGGKKSLDFSHARIGFRSGKAKLAFLEGWTAESVFNAIKGIPKFAKRYIRQKEELDKAAIQVDQPNLTETDLQTIGIEFQQEERFYIDPKTPK